MSPDAWSLRSANGYVPPEAGGAELRQWLDAIEGRYGPTYALETFAFVGGVGFTPEGEEQESDESFGWKLG